MQSPKIRRAIVSVTDKTGIVDFARALSEEFGIEIISTGGTAKVLTEAGIKVTPIGDYTGFPEMMDGRVKTLHPRVHGGLLARRDDPEHMKEAEANGIDMIDMIVVNLYAFEATVAKPGVTFEEGIENIDIGGPSMLRSAAKNNASVTVVIDPSTYDDILAEMREHDGATTPETRLALACKVFETTSAYDNAIYNWMNGQINGCTAFADDKRIIADKEFDLRYGENPHQKAAFYRLRLAGHAADGSEHMIANAQKIQGKELSYNNLLDLDSAWAAVREFDDPTCAIVKHLTPCGIAEARDIVTAYLEAHTCDPVSAYGGVMAFNRTVTGDLVQAIFDNKQFVEAIVAPEFDEKARQLYATKPKCRLLETGGMNPAGRGIEFRAIEGGMLLQELDHVEDTEGYTVPTTRKPTDAEMDELLFAWRAIKQVKSNAILITRNHASVGIGGGQPNRVNSARIAVKEAGDKAKGAVASSDAFMPFPDSLEVLAAAGVTAVIQPGGSIRDQECIDAANSAGIAMVFTGYRHFRH